MRRVAILIATLGVAGYSSGAVDDGAAPVAKDDEMRRHAALVNVESFAQGHRQPIAMVAKPLLLYSDPARGAARGALWAWGTAGRPEAVLEMEVNPARPPARQWVHGVVSLSPGLIGALWDDGRVWKASQPGVIARPVPNAPAPASSKSERLRQMKALARRFSLREDAGPVRGKIQLRLLATPIHRYEDSASGLQDGAIFAFAFGTNPEALLLLEARSQPSGTPAWQYALARVSGGALAADLDGREVWSVDEANPPHDGESYMNRRHAALGGAE